MKAGGTARGVVDLMKEFDAKVKGIGVMIATKEPKDKLVDEFTPLIFLEKVDQNSDIIGIPNHNII